MEKQLNNQINTIISRVIKEESSAIQTMESLINQDWVKAVINISNCKGKLVLSAIGKSGHVARKIAASFSSTGTPAIFIHPSEASHGDLGLISHDDILIIMTVSGETWELMNITTYAKKLKIPIIAITKNKQSALAKLADIVLTLPDVPEVCINKLAPTTSSVCQMVIGDTLLVSVMWLKGFTLEQFKEFHPGGNIGNLLSPVSDIMYKDSQIPLVSFHTSLREAIFEMTAKGLGCVGIIDEKMRYMGIFTDGDLRRNLESVDSLEISVSKFMTPSPYTVPPSMLIVDLIDFLEKHKIPNIFVVDNKIPVGVVHVRQLASNRILK